VSVKTDSKRSFPRERVPKHADQGPQAERLPDEIINPQAGDGGIDNVLTICAGYHHRHVVPDAPGAMDSTYAPQAISIITSALAKPGIAT